MVKQTTTLEARMSRVGTQHKPTLQGEKVDAIVDFDSLGSTMLIQQEWRGFTDLLGLTVNARIEVVEASDVFCGPRLWYMLRSTGFIHAQSESLILEDNKDAHINGFVECEYVQHACAQKQQIIDVRGAARFSGTEPDPRPNVRAGHIPESVNIPYKLFLSETSPRKLKTVEELSVIFKQARISLDKPIVFSCGSGITACIGALAAVACGAKDCAVYDGSWAEWGARLDLPVVANS